jgi:hypothetical protein
MCTRSLRRSLESLATRTHPRAPDNPVLASLRRIARKNSAESDKAILKQLNIAVNKNPLKYMKSLVKYWYWIEHYPL